MFLSFFGRVSGIQLRSAVENIQKPYSLWARSLLVLLLFVWFYFFRVSPACALTFVVCENVIHFLLPNRWHRQEKWCNPAMEDDGQWVVLLPGFIQQQFRLFPDMEKKNTLIVRSLPHWAFTIFMWTSFTSEIWIWIFLRAFYTQQCKRYYYS